MSANELVSSNRPSVESQPASRLTRWCALGCVALVLATGFASWTGTASYEEQLADILTARGFSEDTYGALRESPLLRQLFLDAAGDRELTLKLELALLKYPGRARNVLKAFGSDPRFQDVLRRHGEVVIPVIDYFMVNDIATLWAMSKMAPAWESIAKMVRGEASRQAGQERLVYGPRLRGISAIEAILADGHHFLGQFVFDKNNQPQRVQTDRVLETLKGLFAGGLSGLESKYHKGDGISMTDVAWAGADVLSVLGATKAVAFLGKAAVPGKAVEEAAVVGRRTSLMGNSVLLGERVGAHVAKLGATLASVYLVVRHPSLLSGVFGALGKLIGIPAWMAILAGWWGVALAAMLLILPVLRGVTLLIPPIRWIASAAAWMLPKKSQAALNSRAAST
ncbi:hypothetical protein [Variovorax saccharolyticus]|uniref:hypothetical protein n=1 Tax=Variovorax saccharolyticus TaxID=3053516 RepID=UPI0025774AF9|nr:hypothetical protein [Variovorax sp. J31P216]MDM0029300.1 hypothetical protein [Variovorax sp. J31P216]